MTLIVRILALLVGMFFVDEGLLLYAWDLPFLFAGSRPAAVGLSSPSGEGSSNLPYIMAVIAGLIAVIIYLFI